MQRIAKRLKTISDSCTMLYNPTLERKKTRKINLFLDEESVEVGDSWLPRWMSKELACAGCEGRVRTRFPPEPNGYLHIGVELSHRVMVKPHHARYRWTWRCSFSSFSSSHFFKILLTLVGDDHSDWVIVVVALWWFVVLHWCYSFLCIQVTKAMWNQFAWILELPEPHLAAVFGIPVSMELNLKLNARPKSSEEIATCDLTTPILKVKSRPMVSSLFTLRFVGSYFIWSDRKLKQQRQRSSMTLVEGLHW